jgi:plastocyanin
MREGHYAVPRISKALGRSPDVMTISALAFCALAFCVLLIVMVGGLDKSLGAALGVSTVQATALSDAAEVSMAPGSGIFNPVVVAVATHSAVTFSNQLPTPILVQSTALDPAQFSLRIGPHGRATLRLERPGLYHYYDALSAKALRAVAGNDVIVTRGGSGAPVEGWIAVLSVAPSLHQQLTVPRNNDLFAPKLLVAVVGSTIAVANQDSDAHNFVVDPASPAGAAFVVEGTDAEPPSGWQRSLVVQQPGIYHVYCTLHTRVVGTAGGWNVVAPTTQASGYGDHDPMEAWIIALPAYVTL